MASNKEILEALERIENSLPNGDLDICRAHLEELQIGQHKLVEALSKIDELITDPEDGLIVRTNKNTYWRRQIDTRDINELKSFKQNVTTALWGIYTLVLGVIAKLIFWK